MENEIAYWIAFSKVRGLGPVKTYNIWKYFNSLENAWNSPLNEFKNIETLNNSIIEKIDEIRKKIEPEKLLYSILEKNIGIISLVDEKYPSLLKSIHDPPTVLYYKGNFKNDFFEKCVGVVGARKPSGYGKRVSYNICNELAKLGITIVSGLAAGIDTSSHNGSLNFENGKTIAVLGCGVDVIYPYSNRKLYEEISERGLIISEYLPEEKPEAWKFPARNRIISGLSKGVIVIEAGEKSGSLITTDFAIEQGREVFALPGEITNPMSKGTNNLIKQGANILTEINDVLESLNWNIVIDNMNTYVENDNKPHIKSLNLSETEKAIYLLLDDKPQHLDSIAEKVSFSLADLTGSLIMLELKLLVKQLPGKLFVKV